MKTRNIKLIIRDKKDTMKVFAESLERSRKGENVIMHEEISFQNIDTLRKVLTEKRIELLHLIKRHAPGSIYELARIVDRDLKSVNTDLHVLTSLGLVVLKTTKEERKRTVPKVEFDRLNVEIAI